MPSTTVSRSELFSMLGRSLDEDEMRSAFLGCKAELEGVDGDEIKLEIKDSNRIDLLSTEGLARTLRGYMGLEEGIPRYESRPSGIEMKVDPLVAGVRPFVVAFCARDVELTDEILVSYMNLQEKIHLTYGRGRRRMAIGFYDLDLVEPPIGYTLTDPDRNAFVPLEGEREMTPAQILTDHPKGREFGHLLSEFDRYPLLLDSTGQVLSMPPIINSNYLGRVTSDTRNLFVEATGMDFDTLSLGLNVLATSLADRGAGIESVSLLYEDETRVTPDFSESPSALDPNYCNRVLGLELKREETAELLRKARFHAEQSGEIIEVGVPCYRGDIMHQNDLVEEIAIMYGYDRIEPIEPSIPTIGRQDPLEDFSDTVRELMIGLSFQEVMTFILTSHENVTDRMGSRPVELVEIENPTTSSFSVFRPDILPSLLEFLARNTHVAYPHRVFESGDVVVRKGEECLTRRRLCFAWADSKLNFTAMKGVVEAVMDSLGVEIQLRETSDPSFIEGRVASVLLEGKPIGIFGEVHPGVLTSWQIPVPVLAAEIEMEPVKAARPPLT
jgi:phenylalanyl-tRNA synthetase beta chain